MIWEYSYSTILLYETTRMIWIQLTIIVHECIGKYVHIYDHIEGPTCDLSGSNDSIKLMKMVVNKLVCGNI